MIFDRQNCLNCILMSIGKLSKPKQKKQINLIKIACINIIEVERFDGVFKINMKKNRNLYKLS